MPQTLCLLGWISQTGHSVGGFVFVSSNVFSVGKFRSGLEFDREPNRRSRWTTFLKATGRPWPRSSSCWKGTRLTTRSSASAPGVWWRTTTCSSEEWKVLFRLTYYVKHTRCLFGFVPRAQFVFQARARTQRLWSYSSSPSYYQRYLFTITFNIL